jgi:hypothetical protein
MNCQMGRPSVRLEEGATSTFNKKGAILKELHEDQWCRKIFNHDGDKASKIADSFVGITKGWQSTEAVEFAGLRGIKLGCATRSVGHQEVCRF